MFQYSYVPMLSLANMEQEERTWNMEHRNMKHNAENGACNIGTSNIRAEKIG